MVIQHQSTVVEPEFVAFLCEQAEADACAVSDYLREQKVQQQNADGSWQDCPLPGPWLLAFGLILRLRNWELHQIQLHLNAGMPSAEETMKKLSTLLFEFAAVEDFVNPLWRQLCSLYYSSFLWRATDHGLKVQIALITEEDDDFLNKLADFLLKSKPAK